MAPEANEPESIRRLAPIALVLILGALALAAWKALPRVRELDWLRTLEHADAAAPRSTPAIYRGTLRGPPDRRTPSGYRAAAFWWGVSRHDEDETKVFCSGRERSDLWLDTPTGSLRIALGEADPDRVGLIAPDKDDDYDRPLAFDLGSIQRTADATLPAGTCAGDGAEYRQLLIPEGAQVEVVGCVRERVIGECASPLTTLLSVPDVETARRHRLERALDAFRLALAASGALVLAAAFVALSAVLSTLRVLRPGKEG